MTNRQRDASEEPSSPENDGNFKRNLQIDMKSLVGSAVGNMSISPWSRDVVLAARKGLFIIDLENPLNVPRFLPQGGTWDVADVQWNPHPARVEYIVSTSSEKLLIWNLLLSGKTSIDHILRAHYRAITDINWHTFDPDVVVSTGIDSWLWAWDLRTPRKAVLGLCAFNASGTQVKWNRQDGNILASSHLNEVLIWDRRKGSLPVSRIPAHGAKIYGIDWAHDEKNEIVTCSLDKTIKIWDINQLGTNPSQPEPRTTIQTAYPVWRARNLPFGQGVLSLPQRGETALQMWNPERPKEPVERFEGHTDVVKEFVWRRGGQDGENYQLITWSKDKTLRFWPVDPETMQKVGKRRMQMQPAPPPGQHAKSFSVEPVTSGAPPALSAPAGLRGILAEVRASQVPRAVKTNVMRIQAEPGAHDSAGEVAPDPKKMRIRRLPETYGNASRSYFGNRHGHHIDTLAWLESVKVGKRDGSSGHGSGCESGDVSRFNSMSRPPSVLDHLTPLSELHSSHDSKEKDEEQPEVDVSQLLKDEITTVLNKLSTSKVKLEKADFNKRPFCTFGLHGPWGESTSVFIRVSFTFPRDYPHAPYPGGTPHVDLERNPLISMKTRVLILRRLRYIREQHRPCLEACLRFLLFGDENEYEVPRAPHIDSESSSEDEAYPTLGRARDNTHSVLRGDKNLAEPRTSQGVFSANGLLVCFFRAPPRIVRSTTRDLSMSPSVGSRGADSAPRLFRPAVLSDAVRRLTVAANDRDVRPTDSKRAEDGNSILRIMSNLYTTGNHPKPRKFSEHSRPTEDTPGSYSLLPTRRSTVYIKDTAAYIGLDMDAAGQYVYSMTHPLHWCRKNAEIARVHGRVDHERLFTMLHVLIVDAHKNEHGVEDHTKTTFGIYSPLMFKLMEKLYDEILKRRDVQMLVMLAIILLRLTKSAIPLIPDTPIPTPPSQLSQIDYFSFVRKQIARKDPSLPYWSQVSPSPTSHPVAPALSSPSSSRGSWSSLFSPSHMRRFVSGPPDRAVDDLRVRTPSGPSAVPIPAMRTGSQSPRARQFRRDSPLHLAQISNSWSDALGGASTKTNVSFSSAGHTRRPTFSQVVSATPSQIEKKRVVLHVDPKMQIQTQPSFQLQPKLKRQLACHILSYAEMLYAWDFPTKRIELLKSVEDELRDILPPPLSLTMLEMSPLGIVRLCPRCRHENQLGSDVCLSCGSRLGVDRCSICRLPIKGLSQTCLICLHDSHVKCWSMRRGSYCATGCGCICTIDPDDDGMSDSAVYGAFRPKGRRSLPLVAVGPT